MYQDAAVQKGLVKEANIFDNAIERIVHCNENQSKLIYAIQDKLHSILNQREPQSPTPPNEKPLESDFISKLNRQIASVEDANDRLQRILNHLNQIV